MEPGGRVELPTRCLPARNASHGEPGVRLELTTYGLRYHCSAIELSRHIEAGGRYRCSANCPLKADPPLAEATSAFNLFYSFDYYRTKLSSDSRFIKFFSHITKKDVAITGGKLDFGPWEQIFYGEFDGRRKKRVLVKIIGE